MTGTKSDTAAGPLPDQRDAAAFAAFHDPDVLVYVGAGGTVRFASESARWLLGVDPLNSVGTDLWDYVHGDDLVVAAGALNEAGRTDGYHEPARVRLAHADGGWIECDISGSSVPEADGTSIVMSVRPVGGADSLVGRRRALDDVTRSALAECVSVGWTGVDELVNRSLGALADVVGAEVAELAWQETTGGLLVRARWSRTDPVISHHSGHELGGGTPFVPLAPLEDAALLHFERDRLGGEAVVEVPLSVGEPWAVLRLVLGADWLRWDDTNVDLVATLATTLMSTVRRCNAEEHLRQQAMTDPLTGLLNRSELYRRVEAAAMTGQSSVAVIYCDIDHFKAVNDVHGHAAGDELLTRIAAVLRDNTRNSDIVARFGGDEFVLVCPGLDSDAVEQLTARLRRSVADLGPGDTPVGLSIGAVESVPGSDVDDLIRQADERMYRSKRGARSR